MAKTFQEKSRIRFHELREQEKAIRDVSMPLREARDTYASEARDEELRLNAEIKEIEKPLNAITAELSFIARGLNGQTGNADGSINEPVIEDDGGGIA